MGNATKRLYQMPPFLEAKILNAQNVSSVVTVFKYRQYQNLYFQRLDYENSD